MKTETPTLPITLSAAQAEITRLRAEVATLRESEARMREAVTAEIAARQAYETMPTDRGGSQGPKGRALAAWQARIADVFAALQGEPK